MKKIILFLLFCISIVITITFLNPNFYIKNDKDKNSELYKIISDCVEKNYDKNIEDKQEMIHAIYSHTDVNIDVDESLIINLIEENYVVKLINENFITEDDEKTDLSNWKFNLKILKENYDLLLNDSDVILYYIILILIFKDMK